MVTFKSVLATVFVAFVAYTLIREPYPPLEEYVVTAEARAVMHELSLNHMLIGMSGDREQYVQHYRELGFTIDVQGAQPRSGSYDATIEFAGGYYIELIGMMPGLRGDLVTMLSRYAAPYCHWLATLPGMPALEMRLLKESPTMVAGGWADFVFGVHPQVELTMDQIVAAAPQRLHLQSDFVQDNAKVGARVVVSGRGRVGWRGNICMCVCRLGGCIFMYIVHAWV
jgi:Glyoxalase-like domain